MAREKSDASRERILPRPPSFRHPRLCGAGVDRLAERSGIAKTAIYYHFGNKEGLLAAVLERTATEWIEAIQQAARQAGDPAARLERALVGMRAMLEERPWIYKLFQILTLEVAEEKPEIRETLQGIIRRARSAITEGIREALGVDLPDAEGVADCCSPHSTASRSDAMIPRACRSTACPSTYWRVITFMIAAAPSTPNWPRRSTIRPCRSNSPPLCELTVDTPSGARP
jgi:AcrR family transcriptional regulator